MQQNLTPSAVLPVDHDNAVLIGRVWLPAAGGPKPGDPDACPTCGRKSPGRPGARYCMVCDKTF